MNVVIHGEPGMFRCLLCSLLYIFCLADIHADVPPKTSIGKWEDDLITVQAQITSVNKDISHGLNLYITIKNNSSDELYSFHYIKGFKQETAMNIKLFYLPSKSGVEQNEKWKNMEIPLIGKLEFIYIKPGTTYSLTINLSDRFIIKRGRQYSLIIKGILNSDIKQHTFYSIEDLNFSVE